MDLSHLRYAVEIARTHSISQAAENLYMGQPNLSRAIRDLEAELQIRIFMRTSRGVSITPEGEEFLRYARNIVLQADEIENIYKNKKLPKRRFSVCVPRVSYISDAFTHFTELAAANNPEEQSFEFFYKETNSMKAINKVLSGDYDLAIVRYQTIFDKYFRQLFDEKKLNAEIIADFPYYVTLSADNPLAQKEKLLLDDLSCGIEILHADPYVPSLPTADLLRAESPAAVSRKVYIYERGSQFSLLERVPDAFMWHCRIPQDLLDKYNLVQRSCTDHNRKYKDILVYRKNYKLTELDNLFVLELCRSKREHLDG